MTEKEFRKLAKKHLTVLEGYEVDKNGNKSMHIVGIDKLYEQLTLTDVVSTCCSNKHVVSYCDNEWCENCGHKYN